MSAAEAGAYGPRRTRELLASLGLRPQRKLGQNFLIDGNLVRKSVSWSGAQAGSRVVEVGPGLGTLTSALLATGAEVFAVEKDPLLADYLRTNLVSERFHLLEGDAVEYPRGPLSDEQAEEGYVIAANLPYAISSPWLAGILRGPLPHRMVLLVQKEAADRWLAPPGTKSRSAISVELEACFHLDARHPVSRSCFLPAPEVDSTLIGLTSKANVRSFHPETLGLIALFYQQRRKQLRRLRGESPVLNAWLANPPGERNLSMCRPEELTLEEWKSLDRIIRETRT